MSGEDSVVIESSKLDKLSQAGNHGVKLGPFEDGLNLVTFNNHGVTLASSALRTKGDCALFVKTTDQTRFLRDTVSHEAVYFGVVSSG